MITLVTATACFGQLAPLPAAPTSNAEIAWYWTGRLGFNPVNGNLLPYGYLTILNGVPGPVFTGPPSEQTALLTFRYSVFQVFPLPDDLDQSTYLVAPATVDIYLDPKPNRNFNNPDSFSTGIKVATYQRGGFQGEHLYVTGYQSYSARLISSTPFPYNGQMIDFAKIAPGITVTDYVGTIPGFGFAPQFPLVYSISSTAVAINLGAGVLKTSAVAGPGKATVVTSEFRLDGTKSTSADGAALKYEWTLAPGSPAATIVAGDSAAPTVRFGGTRGVYTFQLRVTDSEGNSSADFTTVNFTGK